MRFVKAALPSAEVTAKMHGPSTVIITNGTGLKIWSGPQRDLYSKYRWPAQKGIMDAMQVYKEEVLGMDD